MIRRLSKKHLLAGLATAGVLGVGIAAPTVALAGDKNLSPSPSASTSTDRGGDRQQEFAEALAKELGVSTDKVTAALEKLREQRQADRPQRPSAEDRQERLKDRQEQLKERLDQAVKDGKLTQEQADAVLKAVEAGVFPGPGGGHGPGDRPGHGPRGWSGTGDK